LVGITCALAAMLCAALWTPAAGGPFVFNGAVEDVGPCFELRVIDETPAEIVLEFELYRLEHESGREGSAFAIPGMRGLHASGQPDLPVHGALLRIPPEAGVTLEIIDSRVERISCEAPRHVPLPQQERAEARAAGVIHRGAPDPAVYESPEIWPAAPAVAGRPALWHGRRVCALTLQPVRWDPQAGQALVHSRLLFRLRFDGADGAGGPRREAAGSVVVRDRAEALVNATVLNPEWPGAAEGRSGERLLPLEEQSFGRYLVVAPDAALTVNMLNHWVLWRRQMGFNVTLVSAGDLGGDPDWETIRDRALEEYEGPGLDYLLLIGDVDYSPNDYYLDAQFIESGWAAEPQWGFQIVTDHPYSLLEGDDYFADILVGRLSVDNAVQLSMALTKILSYEREPFLQTDSTWFHEALMVWDATYAGSRRETKLGIRDKLLDFGFTAVDTVRNHIDHPVSPTVISQYVNGGLSLVNYRGYGMRDTWAGPYFNVDYVEDLQNFGRWPLVTSIVCGGGDFASVNSDPCLGEAWMRAGDNPAQPTGAVGFIGPSEEDTHTRWNNCIDVGIYQGLCYEEVRDFAALMDRGKIELWLNFPNDRDWGEPTQNVPFYFHCYNLLGDPGCRLRTRRPTEIVCEVPGELPAGPQQLMFAVSDDSGVPLEGVHACFTDSDADSASLALSGPEGLIWLDLGELDETVYTLTLHGRDLYPRQIDIEVGAASSSLGLLGWTLDDGQGNGDGLANPGESFGLDLELFEAGSEGQPGTVELLLRSLDARLILEDSLALVEGSQPGDTLRIEGEFEAALSQEVSHGETLPMDLFVDGEWTARLELPAAGFLFEVQDYAVVSGDWLPGAQAEVIFELLGAGVLSGEAVFTRLLSSAEEVLVLDELSDPFDLAPGEPAQVEGFQLEFDAGLLPGFLPPLVLELYAEGAFPGDDPPLCRVPFEFPLGEPGPGDPMGPDLYGYLIYHMDDTGYAEAPEYSWNDIADLGVEIHVNDEPDSWWNDGVDGHSRVIQLPFTFTFFGQDWEELTVCSNGWAAMGSQAHYLSGLNATIPAAQGPRGMIAAYWTDLCNYYEGQGRFGHLYRYHDEENHQFVIQWTDFLVVGDIDDLSFQIVLRDPEYWPTDSGNGEILLYYEELGDYAGENGFTTGVEHYDEEVGLGYVFNEDYPVTNQPLAPQTALKITTRAGVSEVDPRTAGRAAYFQLLEAAPNPFNPATRLRYRLAGPGRLGWTLHNLLGQEVLSGEEGLRGAGEGSALIDAGRLASGVYVLRMRAEGLAGQRFEASTKLLLLK